MVVTTRARNGDTQESLGGDIDLVLRGAREFLKRIGRGEALQHKAVMRRANGRLVEAKFLVEPRLGQQITGDVLAQQLIIRNICIQCADEIVTILVGVRDARITLAPKRLGVAHPVHPMSRPALSEMGRGNQPFDGIFNSGSTITPEFSHKYRRLLRRGWQAYQRKR